MQIDNSAEIVLSKNLHAEAPLQRFLLITTPHSQFFTTHILICTLHFYNRDGNCGYAVVLNFHENIFH